MAKTGINIQITDTVLGNPIDVNTTSMIVFCGVSAWPGSKAFKCRSLAEFNNSGLTEELGDAAGEWVAAAIDRYFTPSSNLSLSGNLLWVVGIEDSLEEPFTGLIDAIRSTVRYSFDERPRQVIVVDRCVGADKSRWHISKDSYVSLISTLHNEGLRCVFIQSTWAEGLDIDELGDVSKLELPFIAKCIAARAADVSPGGLLAQSKPFGGIEAGALLSSLSVGTSIGDGSLPPVNPDVVLLVDGASFDVDAKSVAQLSLTEVNTLGEKGYLFTRTRPPRNGLWWNDGATCNDPDNALSTLEMGRTICSIADDLQSFFVPYINTRVPVTSTGDIQSTYKQVVLDNARAAVIQRYIDNGDISDARINLVAKDNDMIGTRTWEVTLSILPAPTLRWIDGYVFYVNSLE